MGRRYWSRCFVCCRGPIYRARAGREGSNVSSVIERSSDWFERYLVPPLGTLASSIYLQAVRDAFIIFTLPLIIAGSLFLIVANPPFPYLAGLVSNYKYEILVPFQLSFGLMALFLAFGVAY